MSNPVLVNLYRGNHLEGYHRGSVAVVDSDGATVASWGDVSRTIYPRSAYKMFQALPLLETGAADAAGLDSAQLALACASHSGAHLHVGAVNAWLSERGLTVDDLICGPQVPMGATEGPAFLKTGASPTRAHNNCSGKHCGFLTLAQHIGAGTEDYVALDHPVQKMVRQAIAEMSQVDADDMPYGIDGCSAPNFAVPQDNLAYAMARAATGKGLDPDRAAACRTLINACAEHPVHVSGEGRVCAKLMNALGNTALTKVGAEAVYLAALPEQGLGIALKIDDGGTRAAEIAIASVLVHLGILSMDDPEVAGMVRPDLKNWDGLVVGRAEPSDVWVKV